MMVIRETDTFWIDELKCGNSCAAAELWERYFQQLVHFARERLGHEPRRVADEEDVALSAFHSFCRGAMSGGFAKLEDRNDLRQLLFLIAARKAGRQIERQRCASAAADAYGANRSFSAARRTNAPAESSTLSAGNRRPR